MAGSLRVKARKADHAVGESLSTALTGFMESRTSTDPSWIATSTQLPLLDAVLFRHAMLCSSDSANHPPLPPPDGTS